MFRREFVLSPRAKPEGSNKNEGLNIRGNETTHFFPRFQYYFVPPGLKPGFVRRILIVHLTAGNVDFYLLGHILPSLLACIAALGESYPVERNRFPWHPRTVPPLLVGGSHCVLRSGANAYRLLVRRIVIPGPVVCWFPEFLEHFVGKCRHDLKSRRAP